jgi:hypothetical protein
MPPERRGTGVGMSHSDPRDRIDAIAQQVRARFEADPPQAMTDEDSARLDMIVHGVGTVSFPADRETLIAEARRAGDEELTVELRSLAEGARFGSIDELLLAMGVGTAGRIDVPGAPPRGSHGAG